MNLSELKIETQKKLAVYEAMSGLKVKLIPTVDGKLDWEQIETIIRMAEDSYFETKATLNLALHREYAMHGPDRQTFNGGSVKV